MTEKVESESQASEVTTAAIQPRYETPQILALNALTRGQGAVLCLSGSSATSVCSSGSAHV